MPSNSPERATSLLEASAPPGARRPAGTAKAAPRPVTPSARRIALIARSALSRSIELVTMALRLAALVAACLGAIAVAGHGMLSEPAARNVLANSDWCPQCLSAGGARGPIRRV